MLKLWRSLIVNYKNITRSLCTSPIHFQKCTKTPRFLGPPWRILFFGTDSFALESLKPLCAKLRTGTLIKSLGVVSKKGSVVKNFGEAEKLICYEWPVKPDDIRSKYDIGMVVSFGNLIPKEIIESFPLGCINTHASVLPKWRGAAPIYYCIMNGDTETGVTIMRIHPHRFDVGEIVRQYRISVGPNETAEELERKLAQCGAHLLMECIRDLPRCVEMATPQPTVGITYAPKIQPNLANVDWTTMTAVDVYNLHRALKHVYPLKTEWHGIKLKLLELQLAPESLENKRQEIVQTTDVSKSALDFLNRDFNGETLSKPTKIKNVSNAGQLSFNKKLKTLNVLCNDGNSIIVNKLNIRNKTMSPLDFYNGFMSKKSQENWKFDVI